MHPSDEGKPAGGDLISSSPLRTWEKPQSCRFLHTCGAMMAGVALKLVYLHCSLAQESRIDFCEFCTWAKHPARGTF